MKSNLSAMDRTVRVIAAVAVGIFILTGTLSGVPAIILGVVGVVLLLTGLVSFCPLYAAFGFSTRKSEAAK